MQALTGRQSVWLSILATVLVISGCANMGGSQASVGAARASAPLAVFVDEDVAYLSGYLTSEVPEQITSLINDYPNVTDLVLVDVPGSLDQDATIEAARLIRRFELNTHIAKTGYVLSGGVDLFLGGVERTIGAGAGVGVHSWRDVSHASDDIDLSDPVHASYVNFYLAMGVPERFYWFTLDAAPAERIYFLSPEEFYDYRLVTD
ncbi:alpha/beta hydrolase [Marinomonas ostreistagni]|uniref:COG3904 family protein n=1 Tax=Marinomonas ostreistagni TaxID=359209 RepID=UPI001951A92A|nr:alpha/beta hydrolase [Marinomonas ostreistagni]MBM6551103.1 alpha/beta hydrolase [Marinomonas ostreistagni]